MPVIRGEAKTTRLTADCRRGLLQELANELSGSGGPNGPVIFEIPLEQSEKMDVIVVWPAFEGLSAEDRTGLILDAYQDKGEEIAQALGVTYQEALQQQLLPYAVVLLNQRAFDIDEVRIAILSQGGTALGNDKIDLRFPTMAMAEAAHRRLCEQLPQGVWSIVQGAAPIP